MIFDLIVIAIFIVMIVIYVHRGAVRSLGGILASIISYFAATALGTMLSAVIYDSMISPAINKAITEAISEAGAGAAGNIADTLPSWLSGLLTMSGIDLSKLIEQPMTTVTDTVVKAADAAIRPIATGILTFFITIILFLILFILLRFLINKPLQGIMRAPVLNGINKFFGGVIGLISAFLLVSMLAYLVKLILSHSGTRFGWFSESTIYNSFIFYHFYSGNIFSWMVSLFTGK